jgi:Fic family protein
MTDTHLSKAILDFLISRTNVGPASPAEITAGVGGSRPTVNRYLRELVATGQIVREGNGPATAYRYGQPDSAAVQLSGNAAAKVSATGNLSVSPGWSSDAQKLRALLSAPLASRKPVSYQRRFVDDYQPNRSSLLPANFADTLLAAGRMQGQQPAGTYARKVLEQLLIDLSWYSSRLEGNRKTLLDTRTLFEKGRSTANDSDATMLLNHRDAIEFMVDAVPTYGITTPVIRNIQSLLMQGLLANPDSLGRIRAYVVNITDTVYVPTQVPGLLEEMLDLIVEKTQQIKNPVEAAFFLWVNIAYLQPFEDGNKRTSRLSANLPLMLSNCAPLSFAEVELADYTLAMLGVYEQLDTAIAVELFVWTYQRSIDKYRIVVESLGPPDPIRSRYREHLGAAIRDVVSMGRALAEAVAASGVPDADLQAFRNLVSHELQHLEPYNCARYRLSIGKTEDWVAHGRPM